ncbi:MAG: hypothetical protein GX352_06170 [Clostridiales bacterium]|nr:hypothetical protein [Clostridiales bacterium]
MNVGIPRALLYFDYFPLWQTFLSLAGFEITISPPTNKDILNKGVSLCVDDACLPVKLFHGHTADLADKVDVIFIPRLISISPGEYICPKFIGLPEMIKNSVKGLPPLIIFDYNLHKDLKGEKIAFGRLGTELGVGGRAIDNAYKEAKRRQLIYRGILESGQNPLSILYPKERWDEKLGTKGTIGVIGHPYLLYDRYISMDIIRKILDNGYNVKVPANVSHSTIEKRLENMPKNLFWSYGKRILGSGMDWLADDRIHGIIFVDSFGCGIDSFVGELLHRYNIRGRRLPYTTITLDEHTGRAGFDTRLEAFLDMMEWAG